MAQDRKREPIWPFMIPATLIAAAWAAAIVYASFETIRGEDHSAFYWTGYFLGSSFTPSIVIWLLFYLLFLRPRATIGKSLKALGLIWAFVFGLQFTPLAVLKALRGDDSAAQAHMQESVTRVRALSDRVTAEVAALGLQADETQGVQNQEHAVAWLGRVRQAATLVRAYDAGLAEEAANTHTAFAGFRLSDRRRDAYLREMDAAIGAEALLRRANAVRISELDKTAEVLAVLADHPDDWTIQGGVPTFYDSALLARHNAVAAELQALRAERLRLERELVATGVSSAESPSPDPGTP